MLLCRKWKSGGAGALEKLEAHQMFWNLRQFSSKPKPPKTCYQAPENMSPSTWHPTWLEVLRSWSSAALQELEVWRDEAPAELEAHQMFWNLRQCSAKPKPPKTCYQVPESTLSITRPQKHVTKHQKT
jgi:hypothetical protein